jgi:transketolase
MLQYALLHLYGYGITIDDLKAFRVCFPDSAFLRRA